MYWNTTGIPSIGKTYPDRKTNGSRKKIDICIACIWVSASVEISIPRPRTAAMKMNPTAYSSTTDPMIGMPNRNLIRRIVRVSCR